MKIYFKFLLILTLMNINSISFSAENPEYVFGKIAPLELADATNAQDNLNFDVVDYDAELASFASSQLQNLINRCAMFYIQLDMGEQGENGMTASEIASYESTVNEKCLCRLGQSLSNSDPSNSSNLVSTTSPGVWEDSSNTASNGAILGGSCNSASASTLPGRANILEYTINKCVNRRIQLDGKVDTAQCGSEWGKDVSDLSDTCKIHIEALRVECLTLLREETAYNMDFSGDVYSCNFDDQTKFLKLKGTSICFQYSSVSVSQAETQYGDDETESMVDEYGTFEIGEIFLMNQYSRSPCIKDVSYGKKDKNELWVSQSCDGEFAIKYKSVDCGYRPVCTVQPNEDTHEEASGSVASGDHKTSTVTCDGGQADNGAKVWCKVQPAIEESGPTEGDNDYSVEITNIDPSNISIENKNGGSCYWSTGTTTTPSNYGVEKKGSEIDGADDNNVRGWGVWATGNCHAIFTVKYDWKRKECKKAGENATNDVCCDGLVFNGNDKICHSPIMAFDIPKLDEEDHLEPYIEGECKVSIADAAKEAAKDYMAEIANYENLFTAIDFSNDAMTKIKAAYHKTAVAETKTIIDDETGESTEVLDIVTKVERPASKQKLLDELLTENTGYTVKTNDESISYDPDWISELTNTDNKSTGVEDSMGDVNKYDQIIDASEPLDSAMFAWKHMHDSFVTFRRRMFGLQEALRKANEENEQFTKEHIDFTKAKAAGTATEEEVAKNALNPYRDDNLQLTSVKVTHLGIQLQMIYSLGLEANLLWLENRMKQAVQIGADLLWTCAHNTDCSKSSWFLYDENRENVADIILDPVYPYLYSSKSISLESLEYPLFDYKKSITTVSNLNDYFDVFYKENLYDNMYNYEHNEYHALPQQRSASLHSAGKLFKEYSIDIPLKDSDKIKSNFLDDNILKKFGEEDIDHQVEMADLPFYCSQQDETGWQIRAPMGKLIIPLRAYQLVRFLRIYQSGYFSTYEAKSTCTQKVIDGLGSSGVAAEDESAVAVAEGAVDSEGSDEVNEVLSGFVASVFANSPNVGSLMASQGLSNLVPDNLATDATSGTSTVSSADVGALSKKKKSAIDDMIKLREDKGDDIIRKHIDSLNNSLGKALKSKTRVTASTGGMSLSTDVAAPSSGISEAIKTIEKKDKKVNKNAQKKKGSGGKRSGFRNSYKSSNSRKSNYSSSNSNNRKMMKAIKNSKYDHDESDSLWETLSKRYIRSGYPALLFEKDD